LSDCNKAIVYGKTTAENVRITGIFAGLLTLRMPSRQFLFSASRRCDTGQSFVRPRIEAESNKWQDVDD